MRRSVTLEPRHWRWLDEHGNASAALRQLLDTVIGTDQDAAHLEYEQLTAENVRLRSIAEAAASACREREITPYLIDVLDAAGYETAPRAPDPDDPDQAELDRYWAARDRAR